MNHIERFHAAYLDLTTGKSAEQRAAVEAATIANDAQVEGQVLAVIEHLELIIAQMKRNRTPAQHKLRATVAKLVHEVNPGNWSGGVASDGFGGSDYRR